MNIAEKFRGALRRLRAGAPEKRRSVALPSILSPYGRAETMPKCTPANLRKFAETPIARKAINTIKELKASMRWLVGNGHPGRVQELEDRVEKHEAFLQRAGGVGAALAGLTTLIHFALDYLRR